METKTEQKRRFRPADLAEFGERPNMVPVMTTKYGGVAIVALKEGQGLAEHTAPAAVMVYMLQGHVDFYIDGEKNCITAGDSLLMEAGTPHRVEAKEDSRIMIVKVEN